MSGPPNTEHLQIVDRKALAALIFAAKQARELLQTRPGDLSLGAGSSAAFAYRFLREALKAFEVSGPPTQENR